MWYCFVKKIQILLSTYNGEKYLREQLDSFVSLENFSDVKVLVRDDGSTDSTRDILLEYRDRYGFDIIFGENCGVTVSFHQLLLAADRECEYFAFSDQDDVWLPNKISRAFSAISSMNNSVPNLYCACSLLVDEKLDSVGHTLIPNKPLSFYNAMVQNIAVGHTQVFNRALLTLLSREFSDDIVITDHWAYLLASTTGQVAFDKEPTTLYRQHDNNLIGYKRSFFSSFISRVKRAMSGQPQEKTRQLVAFLNCYGNDMDTEHKKELENFLNSQKNLFKRFAYLFKTKVYRQTTIETLIFYFMYFFGRYKIKTYKKETTK